MLKSFSEKIQKSVAQQVPATGLGAVRILYGLVLFQEIIFLLYFNHLIFDPIPYLDVEFPMVSFFLGVWGIVAFCLVIGYRTQVITIVNYIFWIVFVSFTPMQRDFDGGFDQFMTGIAFFLIFLPVERAFSIDNLRYKLAFSTIKKITQPPYTVSILAYWVPVTVCLGFLYFDSAIHKLTSDHWRNGLGAWLPSTQPYYISAIDMSWLLNVEYLQKAIGYTIIVFQFVFLALYFSKYLRPIALCVGIALHLGITLSFNIYPFGLGMLALYPLLVPFAWWRRLASWFKNKTKTLTVYYDEQCPLCNRTVIVINHFDVFSAIEFKGLQTYAADEPALQRIGNEQLLNDLYALDATDGRLFKGLDTYIRILAKMRYPLVLSWLMRLPGIYQIAASRYRYIADNRVRTVCDSRCAVPAPTKTPFSVYSWIFENYAERHPERLAMRLAKVWIVICILQLNSTLHYGVMYRFGYDPRDNWITAPLNTFSNSLLTLTTTFFGITPHALYLHDHFKGYNHILGITYIDQNNREQWLPFINEQGRIVTPNWGRVHSMWANIAVTPTIDNYRLHKLLKKVIAFWGTKSGLPLDKTRFKIKLKKIQAPPQWVANLRDNNLNQPWRDIGEVRWRGKNMIIDLPDDINLL